MPELHTAHAPVPDLETPVPELETPVPEPGTAVSELDTAVPELDTAVAELETAVSESDTPEAEGAATGSAEAAESFSDIFSQYEKEHSRKPEDGNRQIEATIVAVTAEAALFDIGFKTEGILARTAFAGKEIQVGDKFQVSVKGRDAEGYYELSLLKVAQPKDWSLLEQAFADKEAILGTVSAVVKGGVSVDIGVRAFMPASRSGTRDATDLARLVGQQMRVRIIKLDVTEEDVVVDRRVLAEEEERVVKERRYSEVREGDVVSGTVRSLADYGAFVEIGGVDGLLHVSDIAWSRIGNPSEVLSVGQQIEVKVLKVEPDKRRISLGLKQLQPEPWQSVEGKYKVGDRVQGTITRLAEFGAFVELEPGVEGLIHLSEMSWAKKVRKPADIFTQGESVEAVILGVKLDERRISLGFKQLLEDPWTEAARKFSSGSVVEGAVTSFTKFGAFVQVAEGVEGMVHISEITAEKRLQHPSEVLKVGEVVKAQVLEVDREKRQLKLSIKQLTPISVDEYFAEHHPGDLVTGRVTDVAAGRASIELGEGIYATCPVPAAALAPMPESKTSGVVDLSSLSSMLSARWKGGQAATKPAPEAIKSGQIRSFRIASLDAAARTIQLTPG